MPTMSRHHQEREYHTQTLQPIIAFISLLPVSGTRVCFTRFHTLAAVEIVCFKTRGQRVNCCSKDGRPATLTRPVSYSILAILVSDDCDTLVVSKELEPTLSLPYCGFKTHMFSKCKSFRLALVSWTSLCNALKASVGGNCISLNRLSSSTLKVWSKAKAFPQLQP